MAPVKGVGVSGKIWTAVRAKSNQNQIRNYLTPYWCECVLKTLCETCSVHNFIRNNLPLNARGAIEIDAINAMEKASNRLAHK